MVSVYLEKLDLLGNTSDKSAKLKILHKILLVKIISAHCQKKGRFSCDRLQNNC